VTFRSRSVRDGDVDECVRLLCKRPTYAERYPDRRTRSRIAEAWKRLLKRNAVTSRLIETPALPAGERIVTFGLSAFVRKDAADGYLRKPFPFGGPWIVEQSTLGCGTDVLLTDSQLAQANSHEGLHAVTIALGWAPDRVPSQRMFMFRQMCVACYV